MRGTWRLRVLQNHWRLRSRWRAEKECGQPFEGARKIGNIGHVGVWELVEYNAHCFNPHRMAFLLARVLEEPRRQARLDPRLHAYLQKAITSCQLYENLRELTAKEISAAVVSCREVGHPAAEDLSDVLVETISSHLERVDLDRVAFFVTCFSKQQIKDTVFWKSAARAVANSSQPLTPQVVVSLLDAFRKRGLRSERTFQALTRRVVEVINDLEPQHIPPIVATLCRVPLKEEDREEVVRELLAKWLRMLQREKELATGAVTVQQILSLAVSLGLSPDIVNTAVFTKDVFDFIGNRFHLLKTEEIIVFLWAIQRLVVPKTSTANLARGLQQVQQLWTLLAASSELSLQRLIQLSEVLTCVKKEANASLPHWTPELEELQNLVIQDLAESVQYCQSDTLSQILEIWPGSEDFWRGHMEFAEAIAKRIEEFLLEFTDTTEIIRTFQAALSAEGLVKCLSERAVEVLSSALSSRGADDFERVQAVLAGSSWEVLCKGAPRPVVAKAPKVDPADANKSPCFMLGRDTELAIESRRRSEGVPISSGGGGENCFHLRVFALVEEIVIPQGLVHEKDLDSLASGLSSCLTWLDMSKIPKTLRPSESSDIHLLQLEVSDKVPRGHIILGASFAECVCLPCFGLVKLWRCLQVPAYVPRVELIPARSCTREDGAGWLRRRFETLVKAHGEIHIADGAPLLLRAEKLDSGKNSPVQTSATADAGTGGSSEVDLYEGLSDIDDIYQQQSEPAICADDECGVYEVDLGLDLVNASPSFPSSFRADKESLETVEAVLVYIRLAVGAARDFRNGSDKPPFTRVSAVGLAGGEPTISISMDRKGDTSDSESQQDRSAAEPLGLLWAGQPRPPPEDWSGILQLVPPFCARAIDEMTMFTEPAVQLRRFVEACLGKSGAHKSSRSILDCASFRSAGTPGMIAITGSPGSGKSRLASRVLSSLSSEGVLALQVTCGKLGQPGKKFKVVQDWLRSILSFACWYSPCAILLDDFGALCPDVEPGAPNLSITEDRSPLIAEMLLDLLPEVRSSGAQVALLATMPDDSSVHRMLWSWPALEHKVVIRQPQLKERPDMLMALLREKVDEGWDVEHGLLAEGALDDWGGRVDGFSVADLVGLVERTCVEATVEASAARLRGGDGGPEWGERQRITFDHLERACEGFVPATMADQTFFSSEVNLIDIGGLNSAKQELMDMLTMPTKYAVLLDRAPVRTRKGLMLVGPPGCGKTMLVQAAAKETKGLLRFLSVKGPELLSKYIGESEAGVRKVFERAAAAAPAVIFFDEIEALAPKRGADSTGVTDRVVNQMLCYLDGVEDRGRVFVVAATGRPDMVDPALMRPGRFDKICYCGLPSHEEKLEICQVLARKNNLVGDVQLNGNQKEEDLNANLQQLVSRLPRLFTSADISALFSSAKIEAVNESLQKDGPKEPKMTMSHLFGALATSKASVSEVDERRYAQIFGPYCGGSGSRGGPEQETKPVKVALA